DLATRSTGDGLYRSNDVEQARRFFAGVDTLSAVTNEFERADAAPYATKGDGRLRADDFQLVSNYVAGLVSRQTAGGPDTATFAEPVNERDRDAATERRVMRIVQIDSGIERAIRPPLHGKASIAVELDSLGDETVALFSLKFDPAVLSHPVVTLGEEMPPGMTLTANASDGKVTILLDSSAPFEAGYSRRLVVVTFDVAKADPVGETPITFDGSGSFADMSASPLTGTYKDAVINVKRGAVSRNLLRSPFRLHAMARDLAWQAILSSPATMTAIEKTRRQRVRGSSRAG
ncbi:MAG TPA: cohesin domain-containing protein, partial [Pyrinomonadaceae bacterium]|nr:cohesin domain-containing protein [Pyrinomonadaceae bacterium]